MDKRMENGGELLALKEWASAIGALRTGKQIMLLRKGGIIEETRDFKLLSPRFYLLPTFEHQRRELVKPEYQGLVDESLEGWEPDKQSVTLDTFAEAALDIEVNDQETLDELCDYHIWTDSFADERLRWKRKQPLHVLLLRVWRLNDKIEVPLRPAYIGCKSWVRLEDGVPAAEMSPVLTEDQFQSQVEEIKRLAAKKG